VNEPRWIGGRLIDVWWTDATLPFVSVDAGICPRCFIRLSRWTTTVIELRAATDAAFAVGGLQAVAVVICGAVND